MTGARARDRSYHDVDLKRGMDLSLIGYRCVLLYSIRHADLLPSAILSRFYTKKQSIRHKR